MSAAMVMIVVVVISIEVESFFLAESLIRVGRYSAAVHFSSSSSACCTPPATQDSQPMNVIRRKKARMRKVEKWEGESVLLLLYGNGDGGKSTGK